MSRKFSVSKCLEVSRSEELFRNQTEICSEGDLDKVSTGPDVNPWRGVAS